MHTLIVLMAVVWTSDLGQTSAVKAVDVLDKAIQAHGGLADLQAIKDITREFDGVASNFGQGVRPETPAANPGKIVTIHDSQWRHALESQDATRPGGPENRVIQAINGESGFGANPGQKLMAKIPAESLPLFRARFQRRQPEGLLLSAVARPETLRFLGEDTFEGRSQRVISYADTDGTAVTLYFDAATGLLTKAAVVTDDPICGDTTTDLVFKDYADENGVKLPHRYQEMLGGQVTRDMRITSLRINTSPAESLFAVPEGYTTINSTPPPQGTVKMADNVYLVQGSYSNMFAVFPEYVVVLEGPLSNAFSDQVLREIKKVAPDKPVKYVVVTHFHSDHISGIRRWVAEGATIVCPPTARQAIERAVAAQHRLRPDALSRNPKAPVFEIVKGQTRVFEGGGLRLEVRDISPLAHVAEMLVGYFPGPRVLYEADMISALPGAKMIVGPETREFAGKIEGWDVDQIVNVHGGLVKRQELTQAMAESK